ncbi:MAG: NTP transferase domain-containing protein [Steroidobacteraceae bacterium]
MRGPVNAVLLAAGRGSRLAPLTDLTHKSLLPVAGKPVLAYVMDRLTRAGCQDIVCVTGYRKDDIAGFLASYGSAVRTIENARYEQDVNILSTEIGVSALRRPELGYLLVETDIVLEDRGWDAILDRTAAGDSFWVTRGRYSRALTGGALHADDSGRVTDMVYAPAYDARYEGWLKLLGVLYVGEREVQADRAIRQKAMQRTIAQYYMTPWVENRAELPCMACDLGDVYASSYNDVEAYQRTQQEFSAVGAVHA